MSEIQKCPNLVRGGGGNIFQKCLKFKNVPKVGGGGGPTLIGTLSKFSRFFILTPPLRSLFWDQQFVWINIFKTEIFCQT